MIGYVLLIVIAIVMSLIVYQWVKTYVPKDAVDCPDDVSMFLSEVKYDCALDNLDVTVKNNGLFNIAGYFIHGTKTADDNLATEDLSGKIVGGGHDFDGSILFMTEETNSLEPDDTVPTKFENVELGEGFKIELIPIRFEIIEERKRLASCSNARISHDLVCYAFECQGEETQLCEKQEDICLNSVETCVDNQWLGCTTETYEAHNSAYEEIETLCGDGLDNDCDGTWDWGTASPDLDCDPGIACSNGIREGEEECDDGNPNNGDGCSYPGCDVETGWECVGELGEQSVCTKIRMEIIYVGFENGDEINNWEEESGQSLFGETLVISGADECSPKAGNYMLSGTGNFDPNLVRYERTAIDVSDYENIIIGYSMSSEDTESGDRIEFYYYDGSSWEICDGTVDRSASTCSGWEDFECNVVLDDGTTDLVLGVAWETSSTSEHAFWDDISITGMIS